MQRNSAKEIFERVNRYIAAELNRGMVWRSVAFERTEEIEYSMYRLEAATVTDYSSGSENENVSQAVSHGFERNSISGVGFRCVREVETSQYWD